jgi:type IV pilus assembly protein PilO
MMSITAGYEGSYSNLQKFVSLLDKSPRFLIIESLVASPQQGSPVLNVSLKLDAFVNEAPEASS